MDVKDQYAISLKGAQSGRRVGFLTAQQRAAQIVLDEIKDKGEAIRLYRMILDMVDQ